jgi:hypothetical protein
MSFDTTALNNASPFFVSLELIVKEYVLKNANMSRSFPRLD